MTEIMKEIIKIAHDAGVTQREFAKKIGTTEITMSRWYKGERTPKISDVEKMAKVLGGKLCLQDIGDKIGHWIEKYTEDGCGELHSHWTCSECGRNVGHNLANIEDVLNDYPYCHCGAKMVDCQQVL